MPTFAKMKLSLNHSKHKLMLDIKSLVIETENHNKHLEKKTLKKDMKSIRT